jgi:hypothetical protein
MGSTATEYRENAKRTLARAISAVNEEERQEYLRLAAAWSLLAADAEKTAQRLGTLIPFEERSDNPLADESDV